MEATHALKVGAFIWRDISRISSTLILPRHTIWTLSWMIELLSHWLMPTYRLYLLATAYSKKLLKEARLLLRLGKARFMLLGAHLGHALSAMLAVPVVGSIDAHFG